jgi:hypothetical protein
MDERRQSSRRRLLKSGRISFGQAAVPCTVRNLSEGGACLQLDSTFGIPPQFEIELIDVPARRCKIRWLNETKMGVQFQ